MILILLVTLLILTDIRLGQPQTNLRETNLIGDKRILAYCWISFTNYCRHHRGKPPTVINRRKEDFAEVEGSAERSILEIIAYN
jgi:hypothetical protein